MRRRARGDRRGSTLLQRWLRRFALAGFISGWLGVIGLAVPTVIHGATDAFDSYGATGTGWAIQPYIVNDEFINIPAADESTPYVYVAIDSGPSAEARAAYFFPGTAINGALASQNVSYQVPNGVDARYPGSGSASDQVGPVNDGVASQIGAASESAQAAEASAKATAQLASYQLAPQTNGQPPTPPSGLPAAPPVPSVPPLPTAPGAPGLPGPGTSAPTPTPSSAGGSAPPAAAPTATPSKTCVGPVCLAESVGSTHPLASVAPAVLATPKIQLPDPVEQALATQLRAAELANPGLLQLAGGKPVAIDQSLPLAAADETGQAVATASNDSVNITVAVHATHVELFQGLITIAAIDSTLTGIAPGAVAQGKGTVTTTITGMTIAGIPVTVNQNGVQVNGTGGNVSSAAPLPVSPQTLTDALTSALTTAGITISLAKTTSMSDVQKWQGAGGGLEITGSLAPGNGVPATHVDFSLGMVTGSVYAVPSSGSGGGGDVLGGFFDSGGSYDSYGSGDSGYFDSSSGGFGSGDTGTTPGSTTPARHHAANLASIPSSLSPGELLSMLFIVQGFSTAAVASAASTAEGASRASQLLIEEESV